MFISFLLVLIYLFIFYYLIQLNSTVINQYYSENPSHEIKNLCIHYPKRTQRLLYLLSILNTKTYFPILPPTQTVLFYYYHMYCTFAYPIFLCCLPYRRLSFDYVTGKFHRPFLNIILQAKSLRGRCFYSVCGGFWEYV